MCALVLKNGVNASCGQGGEGSGGSERGGEKCGEGVNKYKRTHQRTLSTTQTGTSTVIRTHAYIRTQTRRDTECDHGVARWREEVERGVERVRRRRVERGVDGGRRVDGTWTGREAFSFSSQEVSGLLEPSNTHNSHTVAQETNTTAHPTPLQQTRTDRHRAAVGSCSSPREFFCVRSC